MKRNRFSTDLLEKTTRKQPRIDTVLGSRNDMEKQQLSSNTGVQMVGINSIGKGFIGSKPVRKGATITFEDHPEFIPNLTPKEILAKGSFGGGYFRPITSKITKESYDNVWKELPLDWYKDLPPIYYNSTKFQQKVNFYKVKAGVRLDANDTFGLDYWEMKHWIKPQDPYGWFQWYCRFYQGRRSDDDERQIQRWLNCCGEKGRWKINLRNKVINSGKKYNDYTVSPIIRQTLQHWGYELTENDCAVDV